MRILKIVAWCLLGVVALLAAALAWLLLWFDANQYKPDIEKWVQRSTGRSFTLQGDLKLSVFPSIAVVLGRAELGNAPGFGDEPMLAVDGVRLNVRLAPLLRQRVEVGAVELDRPVVRLVKNAQGVGNWEGLGSQEEAAPEQEEQVSSQQFSASVASVQVTEAQLSYADLQAGSRVQVKNFNLSTGRLESGKPVKVEADLVAERSTTADPKAAPTTVKLTLAAQVTADLDAQRYDLSDAVLDIDLNQPRDTKPLRVTMNLTSAGIHADVANSKYEIAKPVIDLRLTPDPDKKDIPMQLQAETLRADLMAQTAEAVKLQLDGAGLKASAGIKASNLSEEPVIDGTLDVAPFALREVTQQFGVELPATRDPKVLQRFSLQGQLHASSKTAELRALQAKLDDTTIKGSAGIADFDAMALRFNLDVDQLDVDRYLSPETAATKETPTDTTDTAPTPIPSDSIRGLDAVGELRMGRVVVSKVNMTAVRVGLNARNDRLRLQPLQATVYEGKFNGDIAIDVSAAVPRLTMKQQLTGVNFMPLFQALYDTRRISGRGNINLDLQGSGADTQALKSTLDGKLDFSVDDGAYEGVDLWYEIRRARALLKQQATPARSSGAARTAFSALRGSGVVKRGVLDNQDLQASMQYLKVTGKGQVNLAANTLDYRLQAAVLKIPGEDQMASQTQDIVGLTIPITITGALSDPKVRPDVTGLLKERAKQEVEKQKEKVEQKLKDELQDRLKGLFGR